MPSVASSSARSTRSRDKDAVGPPKRAAYQRDPKFAADFREELKYFMRSLPPLPASCKLDRASVEIHVDCSVSRRTTQGTQESIQHCVATDKYGNGVEWYERSEGERHLFPREMQVKKRLRDDLEYPRIHAVEAEDQDGVAAGVLVEQVTPYKTNKKRNPIFASSSSSSSRRLPAPAAPRKERRKHRHHAHRDAHDDDHDDVDGDGDTTETEASHLTRVRNHRHAVASTMLGEDDGGNAADLDHQGRTKRRCSARLGARRVESDIESVKLEHEGDDLASLCGRVGDLEFRSTVEPDTDVERHPVASTSRRP